VRRRRTVRACAAVALVALLVQAVPAFADVDPASDVLLLQNVFLPYKPKACEQVKDGLRKLTGDAAKNGYPIKVAVIGSKFDLGGIQQLYGNPQAYAKFLGDELAVYGPDVGKDITNKPLLIVMPQGYGVYHAGPKAPQVIKGLPDPNTQDPNKLGRLAGDQIPRLAAADGHPFKASPIGSGCSKGGGSGALIAVFAVPIVLLAMVGVYLSRRRGADSGAEA
jgi:hypothetical protein